MVIHRYRVKRRHLTDVEDECLRGEDEVVSLCSPRALQQLHCADFQLPDGDVFPLQPRAVYLDSVEAMEI